MVDIKDKHLVVLKSNGFLTHIKPEDKTPTDTVLFEGTPSQCEDVIHGKNKIIN